MNQVTIREFVSELRSHFAKIDSLVFTSFTFDGSFFENNVLPILFDIEDSNEVRRRLKVNEALASTEVSVFFDGNNGSKISGKCRYHVVPIQLKGRFFHPKNVIIAGRDHAGESMVYVSAASANLTLSGWGRQEEVISAIFLQSQRLQNQIETLKGFLGFLQTRAQGKSEAIPGVLRCLDALPDIPRTKADHETDIYFGGIRGAQPFARILLDERDGHRWDELLVVSPYWHDVVNQALRFRCHSYTLIPTKGYPSPEDKKQRYNLTFAQIQDLRSELGEEPIELRDFRESKQSLWRFRHAKAYFAIKGDRLRAGIGSCNFTEAGLCGETGNVESMIVSDLKTSYISDIRDALKEIRLVDDDFETTPSDDAPNHLPFNVTVVFDWQKHSYRYTVDMLEENKPIAMSLYLPGVEQVVLLPESKNSGEIQIGRHFKHIDNYRIVYTSQDATHTHFGPVIEINLGFSLKEYSRSLGIQEILSSWSASDESFDRNLKPADDEDEVGPAGTGIDATDDASDKPTEDILGYYEIYRAFYDLRAKLRKAGEEKNSQKVCLYLERRSDSLRRLVASIESISDVLRRYLLLVEVNQIAEEYSRFLVDTSWSARARELGLMARQQLVNQVAGELHENSYPTEVDAQQLLNWFEMRFKR